MADITVTAAQIAPVNETEYTARTYTAGATITAGQPVYLASTGKVSPAKADAIGTSGTYVGIALNGAGAGSPVECITKGSVYGYTLAGAYGAVVSISKDNAGGLVAGAVTGTGNVPVVVGTVQPMNDSSLTKVLYLDSSLNSVYAAL